MDRLDESRLSELYDAADKARGLEAHLSNEVFDLISAVEGSYSEVDRLRKAIEEALDRICNVQPNAAGFILAEALKEKD
ncbi:hypothetical protein [Paenibacillus sp. DMB20]|uniref:hypothetical protein n=1 Tax=Paenibacillus sp. DMB20 TaxID=1642570 RepID=UPI0006282196|nr:hypothetical protein [Paenibacillus sp. DMB20]KKO51121.1 hypothetical protein XI25_29485 [Paenibacillus sp. DMB20]